ncbi:hypothetical protein BCR44DRAFT_1437983 [Catenaria anguillulae PL171]|uniref:Uncharacterized protein n=1 Tax=Catenaria anguillulae PL171 TaxID=765915 RepID=A0A1Y2HK33_9FUNG|nr:hypothetical protein BCR44DRAFT_1437983 [Catenaria anguillulae PL171]
MGPRRRTQAHKKAARRPNPIHPASATASSGAPSTHVRDEAASAATSVEPPAPPTAPAPVPTATGVAATKASPGAATQGVSTAQERLPAAASSSPSATSPTSSSNANADANAAQYAQSSTATPAPKPKASGGGRGANSAIRQRVLAKIAAANAANKEAASAAPGSTTAASTTPATATPPPPPAPLASASQPRSPTSERPGSSTPATTDSATSATTSIPRPTSQQHKAPASAQQPSSHSPVSTAPLLTAATIATPSLVPQSVEFTKLPPNAFTGLIMAGSNQPVAVRVTSQPSVVFPNTSANSATISALTSKSAASSPKGPVMAEATVPSIKPKHETPFASLKKSLGLPLSSSSSPSPPPISSPPATLPLPKSAASPLSSNADVPTSPSALMQTLTHAISHATGLSDMITDLLAASAARDTNRSSGVDDTTASPPPASISSSRSKSSTSTSKSPSTSPTRPPSRSALRAMVGRVLPGKQTKDDQLMGEAAAGAGVSSESIASRTSSASSGSGSGGNEVRPDPSVPPALEQATLLKTLAQVSAVLKAQLEQASAAVEKFAPSSPPMAMPANTNGPGFRFSLPDESADNVQVTTITKPLPLRPTTASWLDPIPDDIIALALALYTTLTPRGHAIFHLAVAQNYPFLQHLHASVAQLVTTKRAQGQTHSTPLAYEIDMLAVYSTLHNLGLAEVSGADAASQKRIADSLKAMFERLALPSLPASISLGSKDEPLSAVSMVAFSRNQPVPVPDKFKVNSHVYLPRASIVAAGVLAEGILYAGMGDENDKSAVAAGPMAGALSAGCALGRVAVAAPARSVPATSAAGSLPPVSVAVIVIPADSVRIVREVFSGAGAGSVSSSRSPTAAAAPGLARNTTELTLPPVLAPSAHLIDASKLATLSAVPVVSPTATTAPIGGAGGLSFGSIAASWGKNTGGADGMPSRPSSAPAGGPGALPAFQFPTLKPTTGPNASFPPPIAPLSSPTLSAPSSSASASVSDSEPQLRFRTTSSSSQARPKFQAASRRRYLSTGASNLLAPISTSATVMTASALPSLSSSITSPLGSSSSTAITMSPLEVSMEIVTPTSFALSSSTSPSTPAAPAAAKPTETSAPSPLAVPAGFTSLSAAAEAEKDLALAALAADDLASARTHYQRAAQLAPTCAAYLANWSNCEFELGNYAEAEELAKRALACGNDEMARLMALNRRCALRLARCRLARGALVELMSEGGKDLSRLGAGKVGKDSAVNVDEKGGEEVPAATAADLGGDTIGSASVANEVSVKVSATVDPVLKELILLQVSARSLLSLEDYAAVVADPNVAQDLRADLLGNVCTTRAPVVPLALMPPGLPPQTPATMIRPALDTFIVQGVLAWSWYPATSALAGPPYMLPPSVPGAYPPDDSQVPSAAWNPDVMRTPEHPDAVDLGAGTIVDHDPEMAINLTQWKRKDRRKLSIMYAGMEDSGRGMWLTILDVVRQVVAARRLKQRHEMEEALNGRNVADEVAEEEILEETKTRRGSVEFHKEVKLHLHVVDAQPTSIARSLVLLAVLFKLSRAYGRYHLVSPTTRPMCAVYEDQENQEWAALMHYLCFGHLMPPAVYARLKQVLDEMLESDHASLPFMSMDVASWDRVRHVLRGWTRNMPEWDALARERVLPPQQKPRPASPSAGGANGPKSPKKTASSSPSSRASTSVIMGSQDGPTPHAMPDFLALHRTISAKGPTGSAATRAKPGSTTPKSPTRRSTSPSSAALPSKEKDTKSPPPAMCVTDPACPIGRFYHAQGWMVDEHGVMGKGKDATNAGAPDAGAQSATTGTDSQSTVPAFSVDALIQAAQMGEPHIFLQHITNVPDDLPDKDLERILQCVPNLGSSIEDFRANLSLISRYAPMMTSPPRLFLDEIDDEHVWTLYFRCLIPPPLLRSPEMSQALVDWHCISRHSRTHTPDPAVFAQRFELALAEIATTWRANPLLLPEQVLDAGASSSSSSPVGPELPSLDSPPHPPANPKSSASPITFETSSRFDKSTMRSKVPAQKAPSSVSGVGPDVKGDGLPGIPAGEVFQALVGQRWVWEELNHDVRNHAPEPPVTLFDWSSAMFARIAFSMLVLFPEFNQDHVDGAGDNSSPIPSNGKQRKSGKRRGSAGNTKSKPRQDYGIAMTVQVAPVDAAMAKYKVNEAQFDRIILGTNDGHGRGWLPTALDAGALLKPVSHAHLVQAPFPCVPVTNTIGLGGNRWMVKPAPPGSDPKTTARSRPTLFFRHADQLSNDEFHRAVKQSMCVDSTGHVSQLLGVTPLVATLRPSQYAGPELPTSASAAALVRTPLDYRWAVSTAARDTPIPLAQLDPAMVSPQALPLLPDRTFPLSMHGFFAIVLEQLYKWTLPTPGSGPLPMALAQTKMANWSPFAIDYQMALARWLPALQLGIRLWYPLPSNLRRVTLPNIRLAIGTSSDRSARALAVVIGRGLAGPAASSAMDVFRASINPSALAGAPASVAAAVTVANDHKPPLLDYVCKAANGAASAVTANIVSAASGGSNTKPPSSLAATLASATAVHVLSNVEWVVHRNKRVGPNNTPSLDLRFELPAALLASLVQPSKNPTQDQEEDDPVQVLVIRADRFLPVTQVRRALELVAVDQDV